MKFVVDYLVDAVVSVVDHLCFDDSSLFAAMVHTADNQNEDYNNDDEKDS